MRAGATPVLIPNTTVKTCTADGTILETVWKSRRLPDLFYKIADAHRGRCASHVHGADKIDKSILNKKVA